MIATRPNGGYAFHGGCHGCTNDISACAGCMYMEPNWKLPDLNTAHAEDKKIKEYMKAEAYRAAKHPRPRLV